MKKPANATKSAWARFLSMPRAPKYSAVFIGILLISGFGAPILAPYGYEIQNVNITNQAPSLAHLFGTDDLGRDLFSRILYGGRVSMSIALITALSSSLIGILIGTISGYVGGWTDRIIMRSIDILATLPELIIMILVMMIVGRNLGGIFVALTVTGWLGTARVMRAQVMSWKHRPFVESARALGMNPLRMITRHILPNCIGPIIVQLSYQIPTNVLAEAFLSFVGIGISPPTPSWGILAENGWRALQIYPHLTLFPGMFIFLTMLSFNLIGDYLRDRLDPMLRGR